jgi:hypothetical protein
MAFEYAEANASTYAQEYERQKEQEANGDNKVPMLYPKKGVTQIRVMPPTPTANGRWLRHVEEHTFQVGGRWVTTSCPRAPEYNLPCPICERGEAMFHEGTANQDAELVKKADNFKIRHTYLANVICYSSPDPEKGGLDKGVMVMKFGTKVKQQLLSLNQDVGGGWADITSLANGVDLRLTRSGDKQTTVYTVNPLPKRSNVQVELAAQGYDLNNMTLFNLDELYPPRPYEDLVALMEGRQRTPGFRPAPTSAPATPVDDNQQPANPAPQAPPAQAPVAPQPVAPVQTTVMPTPAPVAAVLPTPVATEPVSEPVPVAEVEVPAAQTPPPMPTPPPTATNG